MINPWQDLFNAWIDNLGTEKKEMKQYEVKLETKATISVFVDASDEDEAIEIALDYLDEKDAELGEWEVTDVQRDYE
jgi:ABC-type transporter MlaC component